jgi:hypothetical protein
MLYTVAIAICLSSVNVHECDQVSARNWVVAPEQASSLNGCMIKGMEYVATAGVVTRGSYAKVFCRPGSRGWPRERTI